MSSDFRVVSHSSSYARLLRDPDYRLTVKMTLFYETQILFLFDSMGRLYTNGRTHGSDDNERGCACNPATIAKSYLGILILQIQGGVH